MIKPSYLWGIKYYPPGLYNSDHLSCVPQSTWTAQLQFYKDLCTLPTVQCVYVPPSVTAILPNCRLHSLLRTAVEIHHESCWSGLLINVNTHSQQFIHLQISSYTSTGVEYCSCLSSHLVYMSSAKAWNNVCHGFGWVSHAIDSPRVTSLDVSFQAG